MADATRVRVLHVITELGIGGAEQMLVKLLRTCDRRRFEVAVVVLMPGGALIEDIRALGFEVWDLGMTRGRSDPRAFLRMLGHLRRFRPQVLQAWLYHAELLSTLALLLLPDLRTRLFWNIRGSLLDPAQRSRGQRLICWLLARLSRRPEAVIVNSQAGRDYHESLGYRPRRWLYLPNGFDTQRFTPDAGRRSAMRRELALPHDAFVIGHVARWDPLKDHPTMFEALARHFAECPDSVCIFVGLDMNADNPALDARFRPGGRFADRIRLLDQRRDVERLYAAFDLFVSSSWSEGFPNVIGEAMASALPVVATDAGESRALVDDCGRVVPVRDPGQLAAALTAMAAQNAEHRQDQGRSARHRIVEHFGLDAVSRRFWSLYGEAGAGGGSGSERGTVRDSQVT